MSKLTNEQFFDICEYVCINIDTYIENYQRFGSYLPFDDYVLTRIATQLMFKYSRYDVQECFEHPKMKAILSFYSEPDIKTTKVH